MNVYNTELHPTAVRALGAGVSKAMGRIGVIMTPFLFQYVSIAPRCAEFNKSDGRWEATVFVVKKFKLDEVNQIHEICV